MGNMSFIYPEGRPRVLSGPLREIQKLAGKPEHVGMKTNNGSLFEMRNYIGCE